MAVGFLHSGGVLIEMNDKSGLPLLEKGTWSLDNAKQVLSPNTENTFSFLFILY